MRIPTKEAQHPTVITRGDALVIRFPYTDEYVQAIRALPAGRRWDPTQRCWIVEKNVENWERLLELDWLPLDGIQPPTRTSYLVDVGPTQTMLWVYTPYNQDVIRRMQAAPDFCRWDAPRRAWKLRASAQNAEHLRRHFPDMAWTPEARLRDPTEQRRKQRAALEEAARAAAVEDTPLDYEFKTPPFEHQRYAFVMSRDMSAFGLFMEQGTGKTKVVVDTAGWLHLKDRIDAVLVVCPNSIKDTWEDEISSHLPDQIQRRVFTWSSQLPTKEMKALQTMVLRQPEPGVLTWLVTNVEGYSQQSGKLLKVAAEFMDSRRVLCVVDESSRIKSPRAQRTKNIVKLGKLAQFRRVSTGTPYTQGPFDAYSQFKFLDPNILGFGSFSAYKSFVADMHGDFNEIVVYKNLDEVTEMVRPYTYRVRREQCLDLPPKVYQKRVVQLTPQQRKFYNQMGEQMVADLEQLKEDGTNVKMTASIMLVKLLRLQQIVGGFLTPDRDDPDEPTRVVPIEGTNPKLNELEHVIDETTGKMIIWARFKPELKLIADRLRKLYGDDAVLEFHGTVKEADRTIAKRRFQDLKDPSRFFVGNAATGGMGLTLVSARTMVYYSNSHSYEDRVQSEDRAHRIGQHHTLEIIDLLAANTVDVKSIMRALRNKRSMADILTGDILHCADPAEALRSWL